MRRTLAEQVIAMSHSTYHVFEPRPGELARSALKDLDGALSATDGSAPYRLVDRDGRGVMAGTRDECLDAVEHAWWRVEVASFRAERVAAAEYAVRLMFERWDPAHGYVSDAYLTNLELDRRGVGKRHV
jgi:hypothetical protein